MLAKHPEGPQQMLYDIFVIVNKPRAKLKGSFEGIGEKKQELLRFFATEALAECLQPLAKMSFVQHCNDAQSRNNKLLKCF